MRYFARESESENEVFDVFIKPCVCFQNFFFCSLRLMLLLLLLFRVSSFFTVRRWMTLNRAREVHSLCRENEILFTTQFSWEWTNKMLAVYPVTCDWIFDESINIFRSFTSVKTENKIKRICCCCWVFTICCCFIQICENHKKLWQICEIHYYTRY